MDSYIYFIIALVIVILYLDILAIFYLKRSDLFDVEQKKLQTIFVLILPILASAIVLYIILSHGEGYKPKEKIGTFRASLIQLITLSIFSSSIDTAST